jgi:hypothetical protein
MGVTIFLSGTNIPQIAAQLHKNVEYATVLYLNLTPPHQQHEAESSSSLPEEDMQALQSAIAVNTSITKIVISTSSVEAIHNHNETHNSTFFFPQVIEALSHLENLQYLDIQLLPTHYFVGIGNAITTCLRHACKLERLTLSRVRFQPSSTDDESRQQQQILEDWAAVLAHQCRNLKEFRMDHCRVLVPEGVAATRTTANDFIMDPVLRSLSQIPSLLRVSLIAEENSSRRFLLFSLEALVELCHSSSLMNLECHGWGFSWALSSLESILRNGESNLKDLMVDFLQEKADGEALVEILQGQGNARLESLHFLNIRQPLDDDVMIQIADHLSSNTAIIRNLKSLHFDCSMPWSNKVIAAFEESLQVNYSLESLRLGSCDFARLQKIVFYLKLNQRGRGTLLRDESASRDKWIRKLIVVKDDLDCLYYFLSKNPSLCHQIE